MFLFRHQQKARRIAWLIRATAKARNADAIEITSGYRAAPGRGSPKGIRIPVSALRGRRPRPLDDGAMWVVLARMDSNHHKQVQSLLSYH